MVNAADWTNAGSFIEVFSLESEDVSKAATNALISQVALPRGARRQCVYLKINLFEADSVINTDVN